MISLIKKIAKKRSDRFYGEMIAVALISEYGITKEEAESASADARIRELCNNPRNWIYEDDVTGSHWNAAASAEIRQLVEKYINKK